GQHRPRQPLSIRAPGILLRRSRLQARRLGLQPHRRAERHLGEGGEEAGERLGRGGRPRPPTQSSSPGRGRPGFHKSKTPSATATRGRKPVQLQFDYPTSELEVKLLEESPCPETPRQVPYHRLGSCGPDGSRTRTLKLDRLT